MKSPADMRIILIDITNACVRECSNCTRFCGHHKKPFFMDYETFCRAVDSLDGFPGTVGMIGGEPTLHPDFERMARYLGEKRGPKTDFSLYRPQEHFMDAVHDVEMSHTYVLKQVDEERRLVRGGGVWSVMGDGYKKHYETIQDIAKYQALNDHSNPMYHKPALISRKELGISDVEWIPMRDNCWVVDVWSANITPKGAFFCEVAGCLDMLFDGPGGWDIEPGWWKRKPEDFGDQLRWCEICGMACETFTRDANEGIDDVSPVLYEKLKEIGSRKVASGKVNVVEINDGVIAEKSKAAGKVFGGDMPYVERYSDRFSEEKSSLYYKEIIGVFVCRTDEETENCIESLDKFKEVYILADEVCLDKINSVKSDCRITCFKVKDHTVGYVLWQALKDRNHNYYAMCINGVVEIKNVLERLHELVLNPGTLLYSRFDGDYDSSYFRACECSEMMLVNGTAHSIRDYGWDRFLKLEEMSDIRDVWISEKVFEFSPETEGRPPVTEVCSGMRYAVYGAGWKLQDSLDYIRNGGGSVTVVVDPHEDIKNTTKLGLDIHTPEYLKDHRDEYDKVMIVFGPFYKQAKEYLLSIGIGTEDMAWL